MFINSDIFEYITKFLDEKDIINMLSINKKFSQDSFIERIVLKRYPILSRFNKRKKSVRKFYVNMLNYIYLIFTKNDIPYFEHKSINPQKFYENNHHEYRLTLLFGYAIEINRMDIAQIILKKGVMIRDSLIGAIKSGKIDNVKFILTNNYTISHPELYCAIKRGNFEIIDLLVKHGGDTTYVNELYYAFKNGNKEIIDYFIERYPSYNRIMYNASMAGNIECVKMMVEKGATNFNNCLEAASGTDNKELVEYLLEKGATSYRQGADKAGLKGNLEILKLLQSKIGNIVKIEYACFMAAYKGNMNIIDYFLEHGYKNYDKIMAYAAKGGRLDLVKLMIEKGANNFTEAIEHAAEKNQINVIKYLLTKTNIYGYSIFRATKNHCYDTVNYLEKLAKKSKIFFRK